MATGKKASRTPGFEQALTRLEAIVKDLEDGDLPLQESLRLFEEGVSLTRLCTTRLEEAQRKIEVLTRGAQGDLRAVPFREPKDPANEDPKDPANEEPEDPADDDDSPGRS